MKTPNKPALRVFRFLSLVAGSLSILAPLFSQSTALGSIAGEVTDAATGQRLEAAIVELEGLGRMAATDRQGRFHLARVPAGVHTLTVTYTGMDAQRIPLTVAAGAQSDGSVQLRSGVYRLGEFVVVSEREGNAAAIAQQRAAANIKNVLTTDALGTMSDPNIGGLLQRLPGISADLSGGEVTYVRVRGIDPNLNSVTVDGTRMANEDLISTRRQFRFNQFSATSIAKIEIVKAPTPDMDADAIGGTINLVSKSAFDSKAGRRGGVSLGFSYLLKDRPDEGGFDFSLGKRQTTTKLQPNVSFFYSDVVGKKDNIGIRIDARYHPRYEGRDTAGSQYQDTIARPAYTWQYQMGDGTRHVRTIEGAGVRVDYKQNERSSYFVSGKYNLLHHTNELNDVRFQTTRSIATLNSAGQPTGTGAILPNFTDTVTEARVQANTNVQLRANAPEQVYSASRQLVIGGRHEGERWKIDHDVNVSRAVSSIPTGEWGANMTALLGNVGWRIDRSRSNTLPDVIQTGGPDWYNLDNYKSLSLSLDDVRHAVDMIVGAQLNVKRELDTRLPIYLKAGARYRSQSRDNERSSRTVTYVGPDGVAGVNAATGSDDGSLLRFQDRDYHYGFFEGRYRPFQYPKVRLVKEAMREHPTWFSENYYTSAANTLQNEKEITEEVTAGYLMGNVRIARLAVTAGVRMEHTGVEGTGARRADRLAANPGANETREQAQGRAQRDWGERETTRGRYTNAFPGIHATYSFTKNLLLRASFNTNIGRPNFAELIPSTTVNVVNETISVTNPNLKPQFSKNSDLSLEYYLRPAGLVSVGVFNKDIRNFIGRVNSIVPDGAGNGFEGDYAGYSISRNVNRGAAKIQGIEFNYQQQFNLLPGFWKNFGGYANYTYLRLEGSQDDSGLLGRNTLGGFVPRAANAGLSYVTGRFSLRLQANYRGRSVEAASDTPATQVIRSNYKTVTFKWEYSLRERWTISGDWNNVFDETENQEYQVDSSRIRLVYHTYPEVTLGITRRF